MTGPGDELDVVRRRQRVLLAWSALLAAGCLVMLALIVRPAL